MPRGKPDDGQRRTRAIARRFVDRAIWKLGHPDSEQVAWERRMRVRAAIATCQSCRRRVGADALCVTLWPTGPTEASRFAMGRARLCEACYREHKPKMRVEARTWHSGIVPPKKVARVVGRPRRHAATAR